VSRARHRRGLTQRRIFFSLGGAAIVIGLWASGASAGGWKKYSPNDPDYPKKVNFTVACAVAKTSNDDPIVYPEQTGAAHHHMFAGNLSTNAYSTAKSLYAAETNCKLKADKAAYWMPTLYNDGKVVLPYLVRAYYRAGTVNGANISPMPFGLKILAGDPHAITEQDARVAGFHCRDGGGATVRKQALPPRCPVGDFLEASVTFPNCWDGAHLDSSDHRSHMRYAAATHACPNSHPVRLPQLTVAARFPVDATRGEVTLASMDSPYTLHADFFNAFDPSVMETLVKRCIHAGVACEGVSEERFPFGT
jgi:hypothetical protein